MSKMTTCQRIIVGVLGLIALCIVVDLTVMVGWYTLSDGTNKTVVATQPQVATAQLPATTQSNIGQQPEANQETGADVSKSVPPTDTLVSPTTTPVPLTDTPIPPTPTPTIDPNRPRGEWTVRAYGENGRYSTSIILVNGHMVGATRENETKWINISELFRGDRPNYVTFIKLNGYSSGEWWGFSVQYEDTIIWGNEGGGAASDSIAYAQTLQIFPDNTVKEVNLRNFDKPLLGGTWSGRAKGVDIGLMFVNNVPIAGSFGEGWEGWENPDWVDISGLLYANQNNIVTVMVWNHSDNYSWDFSIRKEETIVWGAKNSGSGQVGEVFFKSVIIDGTGNIVR